MDRRKFLKATGTLVAGTAITPAIASAGAEVQQQQGRAVLPFNRRWRYSPTASPAARERNFDDGHFARVTIPHTNIRLPWHSFDDKAYEFVSIYRRHFRMPAGARGRRVFVDFEGVMTASTVWLNGERLGEYKGGYTPFTFELTQHLDWDGDNVLAVEVDSTERADIPPFGGEIDYLTFGGIYREVHLRIVSPTYIENIFAQPRDVLSDHPAVEVQCPLAGSEKPVAGLTLEVSLQDGDRVLAKTAQPLNDGGKEGSTPVTLHLDNLGRIELWDLKTPKLYSIEVRLLRNGEVIDSDSRRIGFREAKFTPLGFSLNGKIVKLRGLDRHQTFPWWGKRCLAACSGATRSSCAKTLSAISSAPRIIRSHGIFSMRAMR